MKFFLLFCVAYSITLYAGHPEKFHKARQSIQDVKKAVLKK